MHDYVSKFISLYADADKLVEDDLRALYVQDLVFVDPVHRIEGLESFIEYCDAMYRRVYSCRFEITDTLVQAERAALQWNMYLRHPALRRGKEIVVRGASWLRSDGGKICYHEDHYDLGELIYQNVPVLGLAVSHIKARIGQS